jgi:cell division protein ZapA
VKRSVSVEVGGQKLNLKTDADEDYIRQIARLVNQKLNEARTGGRTIATQSLAILAAMSLADDLLQARQRDAAFRKEVKQRSRLILDLIETASKETKP